MKPGRRLALLVGEESGDARAAALVGALRRREAGLRFFGAGGPRLAAFCEPPYRDWIEEAGVVGLWDVLKKYGWFRQQFQELAGEIRRAAPDALLFVDYPGFNLRLARALRPHLPHTRFIYYISPQVWAWNRSRIPRMARDLDAMLCLFPFEVPLYEASGLPALCVGHPLIEELAPLLAAPPAREENLLGLFPGSRTREVHLLYPILLEAARLVQKSRPEIRLAAAAPRPALAEWMRHCADQAGLEVELTTGAARPLMQRASFAWVCSGTATLEAALLGLPYALVYRTSWLTYEVGRRLVRVPHLGMVNILAGCEVVPEFIQKACSPFALADCALRYLNDPPARAALQTQLARSTAVLGARPAPASAHGGEIPNASDASDTSGPSEQAAAAILRLLDGQPLLPSS